MKRNGVEGNHKKSQLNIFWKLPCQAGMLATRPQLSSYYYFITITITIIINSTILSFFSEKLGMICIWNVPGYNPEGDMMVVQKLHNEELNDLYSLPSIVRVVKSRRMRWAGHVARMGEGTGWSGLRIGTGGGHL
jgi:hypothetical protein